MSTARARTSLPARILIWAAACTVLGIGYSCADERPNIVFLLADDQCTYSMGCYGTVGAKTPNLDQLAREGMVFDRHYDTTAICMASRVNIMTGLYEFKTGCNFDSGNLVRSIWLQSYPVRLREAGYRTAFAGKFGFTVSEVPNQSGELPSSDFDRWGGGPGQTSYDTSKNPAMAQYAKEYPHSTLSYGAFGRDFIHAAAHSGQPFCLSISFKAPHRPVQPDPRFDGVYESAELVKPANFGRVHGLHFASQSRQGRQYERFHSWNYSSDYRNVMAKYYQQIYGIDFAVGMIREALEQAGVSGNTVILYTSDNGFLCGSHGYGSKVLPYEEASCVPMIFFDPRHSNSGKGMRCDALTGNVDIAPTIMSLAGLEIPDGIDGRDLTALLDDPTQAIHDFLPLINVWGPKEVHSLAVVTRKGKYIYWPYAGDGFEATQEAYDMQKDRLELRELLQTETNAMLVSELRQFYSRALQFWKEQAVPFHGYRRFATIFDPTVDWTEKALLYR